MAVLGVDGWRGAWVGALVDGRSVTLLALPDVAAVLAVPDVELIAIDMPIGLSDDEATELVLEFLKTPFSGDERHVRRIGLVSDYERDRHRPAGGLPTRA